jgi:hypothetical protein
MLQGKIAAIIDKESVVINLGSEQGVSPGMKFAAVYEAQRIPDPDNPQNILGSLLFEIAKLQAINVQERMAFCKILDPYISVSKSFEVPLTSFFATTTTESKIDPTAIHIGGPENLKLKVGTVVREVPAQSSTK